VPQVSLLRPGILLVDAHQVPCYNHRSKQTLVAMGMLSYAVTALLPTPFASYNQRHAKMPSVVMTATADQLVKVINDRCKKIHSLSSTVNFQLTEGGPRKAKEQNYTSFSRDKD
jgi:hypothetical protein